MFTFWYIISLIFRRCQGVETFRVYPWTQQFVNTLSAADVTRGSSFPDLDPSSLPRHAQFSMAPDDFLEVYTEANTWDCTATLEAGPARELAGAVRTEVRIRLFHYNVLKKNLDDENKVNTHKK